MKDNMEKQQKAEFVKDDQDSADDGIWLKVYESAKLTKRFNNKNN